MLAAQLTGIGEIQVAEVENPVPPGAGEVMVCVDAVGICGSDVHNYAEGGIGSRKVTYPFIPGHEAAGTVQACGTGVEGIQVGDRVMIEPAMHCGRCDQCQKGRYNTCRNIAFMSSAGELQGCLCEKVVLPAANAIKLADCMSQEQAALAEPLSVAIHSVNHSIPIEPGIPIAVLGAGPIGLCTLAVLREAGGDQVYVTDPIAERRAMADAMGACWIGKPDDLIDQVPLGMAAIFECSGKPDALDQAVNLIGPCGTLVLTGIPEGDRISIDISQLRRKEISIFNVRRQNQCVEAALAMLASGAVDLDCLITHRFPLARTAEAFALVARYGDGVIKAMVEISGALTHADAG